MGAIDITITGVLFDKVGRTSTPCVLIGEATITGLTVGGGPIIPQPPGNPPGIWGGGNVPMPTPPIANVPGAPGYNPPGPGGNPPGIWGGPIDPYPGHPLPEPPNKPAEPITPPVEWKAVWAGPENGWVVVGIPQVPHPTPSA